MAEPGVVPGPIEPPPTHPAGSESAVGHPQLDRLVEVMHVLRSGCPWDAEQTHRTLVRYLVEETCEVIDAIEAGDDTDLVEELGDLLLQVIFQSEIAAESGRFTIEDVAARIADKLIARHPYVFAGGEVPENLVASWEQRKAIEKARSSALDGIPTRLSALSRAHKVVSRAGSHGLALDDLGVRPASVSPERLGDEFLALVAAAEACGLDPEQEARDALRKLEARVRAAETAP